MTDPEEIPVVIENAGGSCTRWAYFAVPVAIAMNVIVMKFTLKIKPLNFFFNEKFVNLIENAFEMGNFNFTFWR